MPQPFDVPLIAHAENGWIFVEGPGIAFTITPSAAADTSDMLLRVASEAQGQQAIPPSTAERAVEERQGGIAE